MSSTVYSGLLFGGSWVLGLFQLFQRSDRLTEGVYGRRTVYTKGKFGVVLTLNAGPSF